MAKAAKAADSINLSADMASAATSRSASEKGASEAARATEHLYGLVEKIGKLYAAEVDAHTKTHEEWAQDTKSRDAISAAALDKVERKYDQLKESTAEEIAKLRANLHDSNDRLRKIGVTLS